MTKAIRWTPQQLAEFEAKNRKPAPDWDQLAATLPKKAPYTDKVPEYLIPKKPSATQRMQAKGRLKDGQMNKTEQRFADYLDAEKAAGRVLWWAFEGIKFKLAQNTHLTVDFAVMVEGGQLHMIDVKGARAIYSDDAKAKMKIAADKFPLAFFVAFPTKGGGWDIEEV